MRGKVFLFEEITKLVLSGDVKISEHGYDHEKQEKEEIYS